MPVALIAAALAVRQVAQFANFSACVQVKQEQKEADKEAGEESE